jgi:FKBP-type peptidyl-prolyl cis-trans isomerase
MKKSILLAGVVALLCVACSNTKETPSGFKYTLLRKGDGKAVEEGKYLVMNMTFKDSKDSVWNDSRKNGVPAVLQIRKDMPKGDAVIEIIQALTQGDSVEFKIPAKVLFEKTFHQPIPKGVDSTGSFTWNIGLSQVLGQDEFKKMQQEFMAKQNEKFLKQQKEQLGKDTTAIDSFLVAKSITAKKTASGLRYIVTKEGAGANATDGQTVKMNYVGYTMDGTYFDTSIESIAKDKNLFQQGRPYAPFEVRVGRGEVIPGWEDAMKLMNKGSKITVYIPSTLGYGSQGSGRIKPNSVLIFDMELVDIVAEKK